MEFCAIVLRYSAQGIAANSSRGLPSAALGLSLLHEYFSWLTGLKNLTILKRELNEKVSRYTHLEIKNIAINENRIAHEEIVFLFL